MSTKHLGNAAISFHTNDEDKDHDTHVTVTIRDVNNLVCAQVDSDWGHFNDQSDAGPFGLLIRNKQTADLLQSGNLTIRIDPNGHDTWRFNFNLVLTFDDGSTLAGGVQGLQLSQNNQQMDFGLEGLLTVSTPPPASEASPLSGPTFLGRYDGVWNPATHGQIAQYGIAADQVSSVYKGHWDAGRRLISLQPYTVSGQVVFDAVFDPSTASQSVVWNASEHDFNQHYADMWGQNMRLLTLRPFVVNGELRLSGVWNAASTGQVVSYRKDIQSLNAQIPTLAGQGLYPSELSACQIGNEVFYYGIFDPAAAASNYVLGYAPDDMAKVQNDMWGKNFRLRRMQAFTVNGQIRYNAVFVASTADQFVVFGKSVADFRKQYADLWAKGFRLISFDNC